MVSFIVIGRNEERNLQRCFEGIYDTIKFNNAISYEIIYIDSKSTDRSLDIARGFKEIKVFNITGTCNAAIARNAGGTEARGEFLYFIDADMEVNKEFFREVTDTSGNLKYDYVSGQIIDIINGEKNVRRSKQFLGGIFLIRKDLWNFIKGMRTKYRNGEDLDLGLRLAKKGYVLYRKSSVITNHYTVHAFDKTRMWQMLWNKSAFYARSMLYRDHLFSRQMYQKLWESDKTLILLVIATVLLFFHTIWALAFFGIYLLAIILRSFKQTVKLPVIEMAGYYLVTNILTIIFFFTFFPKNHRVEYRSDVG